MSYPDINDDKLFEKVLKCKELYSFRAQSGDTFKDTSDDEFLGKYLKLHSHQLFGRNFMNPNTMFNRYHLLHTPGTGKTLAAIAIAKGFIDIYTKLYISAAEGQSKRNYIELEKLTPTVFVLGFSGTKAAFIGELMKYPELGFITAAEREELLKRQRRAESGIAEDVKFYKELYISIKRRITNKAKGGFYKFYGYDEFVNRLFITSDKRLIDLEIEVTGRIRAGEQITLEDVIVQKVNDGSIQINKVLLQQFENSLIICDEVHRTYNMHMKNNRGVAIQFIIDALPSVRLLTLSATPINNSPTEVVELINYMGVKVTKRELFNTDETLKENALEKISQMLRGKISFLQESDIRYFPQRIFLGETYKFPTSVGIFSAGDELPYLKIIPCEMSNFHYQTYMEYVATERENIANKLAEKSGRAEMSEDLGEELNEETNSENEQDIDDLKQQIDGKIDIDKNIKTDNIKTGNIKTDNIKIGNITNVNNVWHQSFDSAFYEEIKDPRYIVPTDGYAIHDIVFPKPGSQLGSFRSGETRNLLAGADQAWRDENGVVIKRFSSNNMLISGPFLRVENLAKYSAKYHRMISDLIGVISKFDKKGEKIMIYHDRVKMSGVLLIQEILRENGFIDSISEPVETTRCAICGNVMSQCAGAAATDTNIVADLEGGHIYAPARFVTAHADMEKSAMDQSLAKFNSPDNLNGEKYLILIGSKIIQESYNFKAIQHVFIMSLPINIPTLLQVLGRSVRKHSHDGLPAEKRKVFVRMYATVISGKDQVSPEIYRYADKLANYMTIQRIEQVINSGAIDADIHRETNMSADLRAQYFPNKGSEPVALLGNLYFEPIYKIPQYSAEDLDRTTFAAYRHFESEIALISTLIKRQFMTQRVWKYDDLWVQIKQSRGIETNPALFDEGNFAIALSHLSTDAPTISTGVKSEEFSLIEKLFDYNDRFVYIDGIKYKIERRGEYYIIFPYVKVVVSPLGPTEERQAIRDKERLMIKERTIDEKIHIDVESYIRPQIRSSGLTINIGDYIATHGDINYQAARDKFRAMFDRENNVARFLTDFSDNFQMMFVEESIGRAIAPDLYGGPQEPYHGAVLQLMENFRALITIGEVQKYKEVAKQFRGEIANIPTNAIIGYMKYKSIRLFDKNVVKNDPSEGWFDVTKVSMNRQALYKENEIIIGYFESDEDHSNFKLRKPLQIIRGKVAKEAVKYKSDQQRMYMGDKRLVESGIVCYTKSKKDLLKIAASLGVSISKLDKSEIRIRKLCDIIKEKLLESEIKERQRDSRWKYVYGWWDEPTIF